MSASPRDAALAALRAGDTLTVAELAAVMNASPQYIRKLIKSEVFRPGRVGRVYRVPNATARSLALEAGVGAEEMVGP